MSHISKLQARFIFKAYYLSYMIIIFYDSYGMLFSQKRSTPPWGFFLLQLCLPYTAAASHSKMCNYVPPNYYTNNFSHDTLFISNAIFFASVLKRQQKIQQQKMPYFSCIKRGFGNNYGVSFCISPPLFQMRFAELYVDVARGGPLVLRF